MCDLLDAAISMAHPGDVLSRHINEKRSAIAKCGPSHAGQRERRRLEARGVTHREGRWIDLVRYLVDCKNTTTEKDPLKEKLELAMLSF
jgi:hypothetical protein